MKLFLPLFILSFGVCPAISQESKHTVGSLDWLSGTWEMNIRGRVVTEHWMKPSGKMMMGTSHSVKDGKTYEYEFIRLVENDAGTIEYIARPSGQEGASFSLIELDERKAVFENLRHDFPQRIIYNRISSDSLIARIEGVRDGKRRGVDFPYRRIHCD
ncbi:MAG: hypothetical protein KF749_01290 [Bacteroidetes bacterium]|nr:hypothetical protein [Bacteroidota bacterium]MCW5896147.1 hypothetical protein [Bacteroidota bacterium]